MSYPPPPGLPSTKKPLPASLPARPPTSAVGNSYKSDNGSSKPAFSAFAPRAVASNHGGRTNMPNHYTAQSTASYSTGPSSYGQPSHDAYGTQSYDQQYQGGGGGGGIPQIRNPFVQTTSASAATPYGAPANYDPEYEAQIQQWQSAYMAKDDKSNGNSTAFKPAMASGPTTTNTSGITIAPNSSSTVVGAPTTSDQQQQQQQHQQQKTVKREGGGTNWTDSSLLEWDPAHFRLFIGNLAGEVTDETLHKAFVRYTSIQKARVIRDKRTTKSKGYGFVSFSDGDDYFLAAKEMNGKYIGSHPVTITKAKTEVKPSVIKHDRHKKGKGSGGRGGGGIGSGAGGGVGGGHNKVDHGGIRKIPKTKGGLKVLG